MKQILTILEEIYDSVVLEIRGLPYQNSLLFGCAVYLIISCDQRIVFTKQTSKHVIQSARVYVETASQIHKQIIFHRKKYDRISSLKREHFVQNYS